MALKFFKLWTKSAFTALIGVYLGYGISQWIGLQPNIGRVEYLGMFMAAAIVLFIVQRIQEAFETSLDFAMVTALCMSATMVASIPSDQIPRESGVFFAMSMGFALALGILSEISKEIIRLFNDLEPKTKRKTKVPFTKEFLVAEKKSMRQGAVYTRIETDDGHVFTFDRHTNFDLLEPTNGNDFDSIGSVQMAGKQATL